MRPSLVNFVVVGVQKAGTTALFDYLQDDPAYGLPDVKEVHFFDDETIDWSAPDYGPYHARFDWSDPTLIRGEATPIYIYWPRSLERLAAYKVPREVVVVDELPKSMLGKVLRKQVRDRLAARPAG